MEKDTIGVRIKKLRESRGFSQKFVAKKVGVSRVAVTKWESGATANLKLDNLMNLCDLLQVSVKELIYGEESEPIRGQLNDEKRDEDFSLNKRFAETENPIKKSMIDMILSLDDRVDMEYVSKSLNYAVELVAKNLPPLESNLTHNEECKPEDRRKSEERRNPENADVEPPEGDKRKEQRRKRNSDWNPRGFTFFKSN